MHGTLNIQPITTKERAILRALAAIGASVQRGPLHYAPRVSVDRYGPPEWFIVDKHVTVQPERAA
jgi:hypothetical protein